MGSADPPLGKVCKTTAFRSACQLDADLPAMTQLCRQISNRIDGF
jgi:hypothetical protein